jgi:hypothetical protein
LRRGFEKGSDPLCREEEDVHNILLKFSERKMWREFFLVVSGVILISM